MAIDATNLIGNIYGGNYSNTNHYSYTFTATQSITPISFLFRNDPSFFNFDNASITSGGANLFTNGSFSSGGMPPLGWKKVGTDVLRHAGIVENQSWYDGSVDGFSGISQNINTVIGASYTIEFDLSGYWTGLEATSVLRVPEGGPDVTQVLVYAGCLPAGLVIGSLPVLQDENIYYTGDTPDDNTYNGDTPANDTFTTATGSLDGSDADGDTIVYDITGGTTSADGLTVSIVGTYGTLTVTKATGAYTYDPNDATVNALNEGTYYDTFNSVVATDAVCANQSSVTKTLKVTIAGVNETVPVVLPPDTCSQNTQPVDPDNTIYTASQLIKLSASQIKSMQPGALINAVSQFQDHGIEMSPNQIKAITVNQIKSIATANNFTAYQLNNMTKNQLSAFIHIGCDQNDGILLAKLKPVTLASFSLDTISSIHQNEAPYLTIEQVKALSPAQIGVLSDTSVSVMATNTTNHASVIKSLTPSQINALSNDRILAESVYFTNAQIKGLSSENLNGPGVINVLSGLNQSDPIKQLTNTQVQQLTGANLNTAQTKLSASQIKAITKDQLNDANFTPSMNLITKGLTKAQIQTFSPTKLEAIISNFGAEEMSWLSNDQVKNLTNSAIQSIPQNAISGISANQLSLMNDKQLQAFSANQAQQITPVQFSKLTLEQQKDLFESTDHLSITNIASIKPTVIANMTASSFASFQPNIVESFSAVQISSITPEQFHQISTTDIAKISAVNMKYLTSDQVDVLTNAQMVALTKTQVQNLPTNIVSLLTNEQISGTTKMDVSKFTPAQIKALSTDVIGNLATTQAAQLTADQALAFTKDQWFALGDKVNQLSDAAIKGLGSFQILSISDDQFGKLLTNANFNISDLSISAVQAIDAEKWDEMTYDLIDGLSAMQIKNLSINAISAFDKFDAALLSGTQTKALTDTQLNAMALNAKEAFQSLGHNGSGTALNVYTDTVTTDDLGTANVSITNFFNVSVLRQLSSETMKAFADNQETAFYTGTPSINGTAVTDTGTASANSITQFSAAQQVYLVGVNSGGTETAITGL